MHNTSILPKNRLPSESPLAIVNNRRILLKSRPKGAPTEHDFRLEVCIAPVPASGELLLRNLYLSLDPSMRGRMSDEGKNFGKDVVRIANE